MGQKEKLIARLGSYARFHVRRDGEAFGYLGFVRSNKGATSGSRVRFCSEAYGVLDMHKPHPGNVLKPYQVRQLIETLERKGLI